VQTEVSFPLVCGIAASSDRVAWAHVVTLARLLAVQPVESKRALWDDI